MAQANVDVRDVAMGIKVCELSMSELQAAATWLLGTLEQAGASWHDEKYEQLSAYVNEACEALRNPVGRIDECRARLVTLRGQVEAYDGLNL